MRGGLPLLEQARIEMTVDVPELASGVPPRTELLRLVLFGESYLQIESHALAGKSWRARIIGTPDETPEKPLPHRPFTTRRVAHQHEHDQFRLFQPGPSPLGVSTHSTRPTPCMSEYRGFIDHRLSALMEHDPGTDGQSRIQGTADRPHSATPGRRLGRVFASRP